MLGLDRRRGHAGGGERAQHRRFDRERGPTLGHERRPVVARDQQHFAQIAPGEPPQPALGNAGQAGDALGESGHSAGKYLNQGSASASTRAKLGRALSRSSKARASGQLPAMWHHLVRVEQGRRCRAVGKGEGIAPRPGLARPSRDRPCPAPSPARRAPRPRQRRPSGPPAAADRRRPLHRPLDVEIENPVPEPYVARGIVIFRHQPDRTGMMRVQIVDDDARLRHDRAAAPSSSTGIFAIGHKAAKAARESGSPRSTSEFEIDLLFVERDQRLPAIGRERMGVKDKAHGVRSSARNLCRRPRRLGHVAPGRVEIPVAAIIRIGDRPPLAPRHMIEQQRKTRAAAGRPQPRDRRDSPCRARRYGRTGRSRRW